MDSEIAESKRVVRSNFSNGAFPLRVINPRREAAAKLHGCHNLCGVEQWQLVGLITRRS